MTLPAVSATARRPPTPVRRLAAAAAWVVSVTLAAALAFAYALPQRLTDTDDVYARLATVAFFGRVFTFHAGLLLATTSAVALMLRRRGLAAFAGIAAAAALWPTGVACLPRHPAPAAGRSVRVMSMNTKYGNRDGPDVVAQVRRFNPDVLAVEEFAGPVRRALDAALQRDYPYRCLRSTGGVGLAVYSRLPFVGSPQVASGGVRRQIRAVVQVDGRDVALYVLHPLSPRSPRRVVLNRLFTADLVDQLRREPLPVILAGDFNFTAETPNAAALTGLGLTDAFDLAGVGRGSTWPVRPAWASWLPGVRIDHVYLSAGLTCAAYATGGPMGSDHLPIVADVAGTPQWSNVKGAKADVAKTEPERIDGGR
jgi:endonuclease/exonuclease/phosphatase (EEP) superfamily protein YafD